MPAVPDEIPVVIPVALGPGDDDPTSQARGIAAPVTGPLGAGESASEATPGPAVPVALGPGDADPTSKTSVAATVKPPLGAGDTDPRSKAHETPSIPKAALPGDGDDDGWDVRAPRPLGPGDPQVPRPVVRVKRKTVSTGA